MTLKIDSHQHFWQLGRYPYEWLSNEGLEPINRTYLPTDLEPHLDATGIDHSVFVQTQHNTDETRWICSLADDHDFLVGVVGWVDLASEQCEEQLLSLKEHPKFVGVRHVTHDEPDVDFIVRDDVLRGLAVLEKHRVPFDLLFFVEHLHHAKTIAERLPELPLVIDHLAKPHIKDGRNDNWLDNIRAAAALPNVYCKLSGMVTEADWQNWKPADLRPYVDTALELFGPQRCMFGSDWPVCELAGTYEQVHAALTECIAELTDDEQARILGGTAIDFYRLNV